MARSLAELAKEASPEAVSLARAVLEQDVADREWALQIGPSLAQRDVARLLGRSEQAASKDTRLLRIHNRDGRPVYPVFQFDGRRQKPGVASVVKTLAGVLEPLTVASWFTGPNRALGGRAPIEALDDGDIDATVAVARRLANRAST